MGGEFKPILPVSDLKVLHASGVAEVEGKHFATGKSKQELRLNTKQTADSWEKSLHKMKEYVHFSTI